MAERTYEPPLVHFRKACLGHDCPPGIGQTGSKAPNRRLSQNDQLTGTLGYAIIGATAR